jgi:hypothetical protein
MAEESRPLSGFDWSDEVVHAPRASPIPIEAGTKRFCSLFLKNALMWSRISFSLIGYTYSSTEAPGLRRLV